LKIGRRFERRHPGIKKDPRPGGPRQISVSSPEMPLPRQECPRKQSFMKERRLAFGWREKTKHSDCDRSEPAGHRTGSLRCSGTKLSSIVRPYGQWLYGGAAGGKNCGGQRRGWRSPALRTGPGHSREWWGLFHSKPLNTLIEQALKTNPSLVAAQAALRVARENALRKRAHSIPPSRRTSRQAATRPRPT
jgi:hypothetical protein